jgi:hypothetical protein
VPFVYKYGGLNFLETSGPAKACNGIALPLHNLDTSPQTRNIPKPQGTSIVITSSGVTTDKEKF